MKNAVQHWSGGKDSALCLYHALRQPQVHVSHLLTTLNEHYQRVAMHGVRPELLDAQAQRIGLPLQPVWLPEMPSMAEYEQRMATALSDLRRQHNVTVSVFGDLHLQDLRAYREQQVAALHLEAQFPIWHKPASELLAEFFDLGFRAIVVCTNEQHLDASFCGRELDRDFLRDLPPGVDPCGENGEYHSFVYEAPYFSSPIAIRRGEKVRRSYRNPATAETPSDDCFRDAPTPAEAGFWYCDLQLATA
ncbi:adenine nucleotide alpha hydrolase [Hymenobacter busanensis]|uniref:Adenine nucleotide alpha hydrolase n=1 Tax=Hymenobacter busanensis TaxID=2607656 RepID=A0A7L5A0X2_9BACT|nr:adenine nucleotide alpha hydrolase [Hymenobacter busanensis]KAA9338147.1 adenine nucleotide alpha hydrolase [Hymenobacter busanensis]QHJ09429.1 ATP-binding protein [Hymenobacter busanensis]